MDCIITFKIMFKILGTLTLKAFLNEFKNRLTSAVLQGGPFQNVQCLLAAHSTMNHLSLLVLFFQSTGAYELLFFFSNFDVFICKCQDNLRKDKGQNFAGHFTTNNVKTKLTRV